VASCSVSFGQIEGRREKWSPTPIDDHRPDAIGQIGETVLDRQDDAVIQRIALGRAV